MTRWVAGISLVAVLVVVIAAATLVPGRVQEVVTGGRVESESGRDIYLRHCAVCHGLEGYGNGPLAEAMIIAPSDLTGVSAKHDGTFPKAKVADVIRTGGGVLGHGTTAMPAWGLYFAVKRHPEVARGRINALVDYIESIQK